MKLKKEILIMTMAVILFIVFGGFKTITTQSKWIAPASADKIVNPLKNDANAAASGKKLYKVMCFVCHGPKGKGDGMAGAGLTPKPTDLTTDEFQSQTDGAIFWKIAEGRAPMASYKTSIPEKKRWEIINYIRTLKK
jgi:mono/diheme cytochrome c family protein